MKFSIYLSNYRRSVITVEQMRVLLVHEITSSIRVLLLHEILLLEAKVG